jgi:predicted metalloprotease
MRWDKLRRSQNVEDRRGQGAPRAAGLRLPFGGGIGLIILLVLAFLFGGPEMVLNILSGTEPTLQTESGVDAPSRPQAPGAPDPEKDFVDAVLGSTEDVWSALFAEGRARYAAPGMVVFEQVTESACGLGHAATGPFYCPADRKLYIDLSFFRELARMGGPGDFAQAYVIGHEVGHHVQTLLGTAEEVRRLQARAGDERSVNRLQVAMELQADCYAGVWAHHANRMHDHALLEPGDIDEGLAAAAAIGDDRLQRSAGRRVAPDSFTHGSSADRQHWLGVGLRTGDPDACDTFRSR